MSDAQPKSKNAKPNGQAIGNRRVREVATMKVRTCVAAAALMAGAAQAGVVTMNFGPSGTFSGTAPIGSLTATFTDVAGGIQVDFTSNLQGTEFVLPSDGFYFNLDPAKMAGLNVAFTNLSAADPVTSVAVGENAFKPDGDGLMDMEITFSPTNLKALTTGQAYSYLLTDNMGLTSADFLFQSDCSQGCGTGSHLAAVHVGNTGANGAGSAWVGPSGPTQFGAPEPGSLALTGVGLGLLASVARRRTQKASA